MSDFAHLRAYSEYTLPDGAVSIDRYIARLQEIGARSAALTDRGVLYGAHEFYKKARAAGIQPILGLDVSVSYDSGHSGRLILIAENDAGYRNLCELSRLGFFEGYDEGEPRISADQLTQHRAGLFVLSAAADGVIGQALLAEDRDTLERALSWHVRTFPGRFLLEVNPSATPEEEKLNDYTLRIAGKRNLPVVATAAAHFATRLDHRAQQVKSSMLAGRPLDEEHEHAVPSNRYVMSGDEMAALFSQDPDVLQNTTELASRIDVSLDRERYHVPAYPLPADAEDEATYLEERVRAGARERYGDPIPEHVLERIDFELGVISRLGFPGYFLIVEDMIAWARENDIQVGPGRGSAAGSIVSYCLGITGLCPLEHGLLFERFLNPDRATMPDIDVDFEPAGRERVIGHLRNKYGEEAVGQIVTFNRLQSRAVFRKVAKAFGMEQSDIDRIAGSIDSSWSFEEALAQSPELSRLLAESDLRQREMIEAMRSLEGQAFTESVHPSGVVIAPGPLKDFVPLTTPGGSRHDPSPTDQLTQYDMTAVEELGLLKIDVLGLSSLTVLKDARAMIEREHGIILDVVGDRIHVRGPDGTHDVIPADQAEKTFELLRSGNTAGIFQVEKRYVAEILTRMNVSSFKELTAALALIRPGPLNSGYAEHYIRRKTGKEPVEYGHPDLEEILSETSGVFVYQEQIIMAAKKLAGFSAGEADHFRKAVSKKDEDLISSGLETFIQRGTERGYDEHFMQGLAEQIKTFGRYGFNRSHSAAYAQVAFAMAHLKAHYPAEFLAARMRKESSVRDISKYLADASGMGIGLLGPDINRSAAEYDVEHGEGAAAIRIGLGSIRGIGGKVAESIVRERERRGPYRSLDNFVLRNHDARLNTMQVEALAHAGAFDEWGHRAQVAQAAEPVLSAMRERLREGGSDAFDRILTRKGDAPEPPSTLPDVPEMELSQILEHEKRLLGAIVSLAPDRELDELTRTLRTHSLGELHDAVRNGQLPRRVELVGTLVSVERKKTRGGKPMLRFSINDGTGQADGVVFDSVLGGMNELPRVGDTLHVEASPEDYQGTLSLKGWSFTPPAAQVHVALPADGAQAEMLSRIAEIVYEYPGENSVHVWKPGADGPKVGQAKIAATEPALTALREVVGERRVRIKRAESARPQRRPSGAAQNRS